MPTYRLDLAYDGSGFRGYAKQGNVRTVQGELESALSTVLNAEFSTAVAGRTDAGVHARAQVVSLVTLAEVDSTTLARSLNGILGTEVVISSVHEASDDFNARFSAKWRRYRYRILHRKTPDPLTRTTVWHVSQELSIEAMRTAASEFVGEHDFSSFCRNAAGRSNVRRVLSSEWLSDGDHLDYWIVANAFCHQMVRSVVGHMFDLGRGFTEPGSTRDVIIAADRGAVATVAPAHGLVLWEVGYEDFGR